MLQPFLGNDAQLWANIYFLEFGTVVWGVRNKVKSQ